ncbi:MAG TPA: hypothetical protein VFD06_08435 [Candidatus Polarisedimenticolia bacterium]|nr:hypothetical protein [Candidatus Polarisedimenticolia bacterium]
MPTVLRAAGLLVLAPVLAAADPPAVPDTAASPPTPADLAGIWAGTLMHAGRRSASRSTSTRVTTGR